MSKPRQNSATEQKEHSHCSERFCPNHYRPLDPHYDIDYIGYGIFVGSRPAACKPFLLQNHITHVLSLGVNPEEDLSPEITVKKIALEDVTEAKIEDILDEACQFIDEGTKGGNMALVHCQAGESRSPAVAINYLHWRKGFSLPCAFFFVSTRRLIMDLNASFEKYIIKESQKQNGKIKPEHFKLPGEYKTPGERVKLNKNHFKKNKKRLEQEMGIPLEPPEEALRDNIKIRFPSEGGK